MPLKGQNQKTKQRQTKKPGTKSFLVVCFWFFLNLLGFDFELGFDVEAAIKQRGGSDVNQDSPPGRRGKVVPVQGCTVTSGPWVSGVDEGTRKAGAAPAASPGSRGGGDWPPLVAQPTKWESETTLTLKR
ncbi:hypothetical protein [Pseudomonas graminis]